MVDNIPPKDDKSLIPLSDILSILKRNKKKIIFAAFCFSLLLLSYGLTRPIQYQAEATFKEKGRSQVGINQSVISQLLTGSDGNQSDGLQMMKSRKLMYSLIKAQKLQGNVSRKGSSYYVNLYNEIKDNISVEYALHMKSQEPILKDPEYDLKITELEYNGEVPLNINLLIGPNNQLIFNDSQKKKIGQGVLGQPFITKDFIITLAPVTEQSLQNREYNISLLPMGTVARQLVNQFQIEPDRSDKSLLKISYRNPDRHRVAETITHLMDVYEDHLKAEHERICCVQIDYLTQRQQEMGAQLTTAMKKHAEELSTDLTSTGFADSEKAIEFLASYQKELKGKLLNIHLDMQRLLRIKQSSDTNYEKLVSANTPHYIHRLIEEIGYLKNESDAINQALRNAETDALTFQNTFSAQMEELDKVKASNKDLQAMLTRLNKNMLPEPYPLLMNNPKYIVNVWYAQAEQCYNAQIKGNADTKAEWQKCRESFKSYLSNLSHYLYVYHRNIEERLAHQQLPQPDFQGINLATAKDLYKSYSNELSDTESNIIQQRFFIEQINDPNFEISSLSTVLKDSVSSELINKTSTIVLALKDLDNRSTKEQERMKADLAIQKGFIKTHLEQSAQLMELRIGFLKGKMNNLQNITLSLLQEKTSLLENQIKNYVENALENLHEEQKLLEQNIVELRLEMATFPQKWAAEQLIEQQMEINQTMVEEITKLVESKNIANNLEKIQSAPLDLPLVPIHPNSQRLLVLAFIGAIFGAFVSSTWVLIQTFSKGLHTSKENLILSGYHVAGTLSRRDSLVTLNALSNKALDTVRRLLALFTPTKSQDFISSNSALTKTILLLQNNGPNYTTIMAELLSKKGLKVLTIDLCFEENSDPKILGLLQFLNKQTQEPAIIHEKSFDKIISGGICRHAAESMSSKMFQEMLDKFANEYDYLLLTCRMPLNSAEAESFLEIYTNIVVTVSNESKDQLKPYLNFANKDGHKTSFIIAE